MKLLSFLTLTALGTLTLTGCSEKDTQTPCVALSCAELNANCGDLVDNCGFVQQCGSCAEGQTCGAGGPNACGFGTCTPQDCIAQLIDCGFGNDGCGTIIDCGTLCDGIASGPDDPGNPQVPGSGGGSGTGEPPTGVGGTPQTGSGGAPTVCDYGKNPPTGASSFGTPTQTPQGGTSDQYQTVDVRRNNVPYKLITNGWGPGFSSHNIGWNGTGMSATLVGNRGSNGEPASYPSVFCGNYSNNPVIQAKDCGLPTSVSTSIKTGLKWRANGNTNNFNVAWDIWIGDGYNLQSYLMVWLHYPGGTASGNSRNEQPAGRKVATCVTVSGVPGVWDIWAGNVNPGTGSKPIINYVRPHGHSLNELEFDVRDLYRDATQRDLGTVKLVGSQINSVAVGFELWNSTNGSGPLQIDDFYVDVN